MYRFICASTECIGIVRRMSQIRKLREKAGLTQAELAKRTNVSEVTVRKWEAGTRTPRVKRLRQIARVLQCMPAELL